MLSSEYHQFQAQLYGLTRVQIIMMLEDLKITAMKKIKHEKTGKATWVCFNEGIT